MAPTLDLSHLFPGLADGWARFDGPAGTQPVDVAIDAMAGFMRSGGMANTHGSFAAADACDQVMERARSSVARLLGADAEGLAFGPSSTAMIMRVTSSLARELGPGDEIVCTQLDHDANVMPWVIAARDSGATVRMAELDPTTGRLPVDAVVAQLTAHTRWVAITGASNALGTMPDVAAVVAAAHEVGARVLVDGVHRTPHRAIDVAALGCDAYVTSPYKWYGPHAGVLWMRRPLLDALDVAKVRPADDEGPGRIEWGTPSFEAIAGITAAAEFLLEVGLDRIEAHEREGFARLLEGLLAIDSVTVHGPTDLVDRAPTLAFTVAGHSPADVAHRLADARVAVWDGHYYAIEAMTALGLLEHGGAVRAGMAVYLGADEVDRLLDVVATL
ncbi:MAG: cysteine desulfurase-like protein [Acidimicrobiales bacterium]